MTNKILYASTEVSPFAKLSEMGDLIRTLPEYLQEEGTFESRIMMPRYGLISERRNRLHEVIRLSGSKIDVREEQEILKVKVASIPGIRLQVYFMDNVHFFKRKGIYKDRQGTLFPDNTERALFFAKAVIETAKNLGWAPGILHAHGWLSTFIPILVRTAFAEDPLFAHTRIIYSSDGIQLDHQLTPEDVEALGLEPDDRLTNLSINELGAAFADVCTYTDGVEMPTSDAVYLGGSPEELTEQANALYMQLMKTADVAA